MRILIRVCLLLRSWLSWLRKWCLVSLRRLLSVVVCLGWWRLVISVVVFRKSLCIMRCWSILVSIWWLVLIFFVICKVIWCLSILSWFVWWMKRSSCSCCVLVSFMCVMWMLVVWCCSVCSRLLLIIGMCLRCWWMLCVFVCWVRLCWCCLRWVGSIGGVCDFLILYFECLLFKM